jgi:hypothetical protein
VAGRQPLSVWHSKSLRGRYHAIVLLSRTSALPVDCLEADGLWHERRSETQSVRTTSGCPEGTADNSPTLQLGNRCAWNEVPKRRLKTLSSIVPSGLGPSDR